MIIRVVCTLLIIVGLFLLLKINPFEIFGVIFKPFTKRYDRMQRIRKITGTRKGKIESAVHDAKEMLIASGMEKKITAYKWAAVIMVALGLIMGFALSNALAALALAVGLGCSPLILIRIRTGDYLRNLNEKLESSMSIVTNSYISSGDLIGAVESSLSLLPAPIKNIFIQFYNETQLIDSDVVKALRHMRERIDNRYWRDWCDVLIQSQRDRQMRYALSGIVSRLSEMRRAQMETDTIIRKQMSDYIITVLIVLGSIPLMGVMMPDWYRMLTDTPAGKITLAAILAAVFATAIWVAQLYRPVEGGDKK